MTNAYNRKFLKNINFSKDDVFIFCDMNDLKLINDKFGHDFGDKTLIFLVETIKKFIRKDDYILRLGGDEFLVIMNHCSVDIAKEKFDKIQRELRNYKVPLSISYGIVPYEGNTFKTLKLADKLMYKMKYHLKKQNTKQKSSR
ncbi:GGDEF domain-containing protein [Marinitoga arctica]